MLRRLALAAFIGVTTVAFGADRALAQSRYELSPFAARNASLDGTPTLMGASLTTYSERLGGVFGMRLGGAYDVRALAGNTSSSDTERGWTTDLDAVVSPSRLPVIGPLLGGFLPTVFTGVGVQGIRRNAGESGQTVVTSYGFGVGRSIGALSIDTEARRRTPVRWSASSADATSVAHRGWEYRIGFSIGFGGRSNPGAGIPGIPMPAGSRSARREPAPTAAARSVLATGDEYLGTRYRYGGETPQSGFDCSGFVQYVFRRHGITLPRTSRLQSTAGRSLAAAKLAGVRAGDLLFFSQRGDVVDHVAIYAGGDRILHSTSSGGGVRYDHLGSERGRWFMDRLVAARRVLGQDAQFIDPGVASQLDVRLDPPDTAPNP